MVEYGRGDRACQMQAPLRPVQARAYLWCRFLGDSRVRESCGARGSKGRAELPLRKALFGHRIGDRHGLGAAEVVVADAGEGHGTVLAAPRHPTERQEEPRPKEVGQLGVMFRT